MQSALGDALSAGVASVDQVARLIHRPVSHVQRLVSGQAEFKVSEIVVIAAALRKDWRPLLLRTLDCARNNSSDRLV